MVILQSPDIVAVAVVFGQLELAVLDTAVVVVARGAGMAAAAPGAPQVLSLSLNGDHHEQLRNC
jgi:acyl transferase domain-containing protein